QLTLQSDGHPALVGVGHVLWSANAVGDSLVMQADGNLVLYDAAQNPTWSSVTYNHAGAHLVVQDDGNAVIYQNDAPLWDTGTWDHMCGTMSPDRGLGVNEYVVACNQGYWMILQEDGVFVLYQNTDQGGKALWGTQTYMSSASKVVFQS